MLIMTALPKQGNNILINNKEGKYYVKTSIGLDKSIWKISSKIKRIISNLSSLLY